MAIHWDSRREEGKERRREETLSSSTFGKEPQHSTSLARSTISVFWNLNHDDCPAIGDIDWINCGQPLPGNGGWRMFNSMVATVRSPSELQKCMRVALRTKGNAKGTKKGKDRRAPRKPVNNGPIEPYGIC